MCEHGFSASFASPFKHNGNGMRLPSFETPEDGVLGRSERSVAARRRILVATNTLDAFVAEHGALATRLQAQALLTLGSLSPQTLGVEHALPLSLSQVRLSLCA